MSEQFVGKTYTEEFVDKSGLRTSARVMQMSESISLREELLSPSCSATEKDVRSLTEIANTVRSLASLRWGKENEAKLFESLETMVSFNPQVRKIIGKIAPLTETLNFPKGTTARNIEDGLQRVFVLALEQTLLANWITYHDTNKVIPDINKLFAKDITPAEQQEILTEMISDEQLEFTREVVFNSRTAPSRKEKYHAGNKYPIFNAFAEYTARIVPNHSERAHDPMPRTREINRRIILGELLNTDSRMPNSVEGFPGLLNHNEPLTWANHLYVKNFALVQGIDPRNIAELEKQLQKIGKSMFWIYCAQDDADDPFRQYTVRIPKPSAKAPGKEFTRAETEYGQAILFIKGELPDRELRRCFTRQLPIGAVKFWEKVPDKDLLELSESNLFVNLT
jgi:hypothetical protein